MAAPKTQALTVATEQGLAGVQSKCTISQPLDIQHVDDALLKWESGGMAVLSMALQPQFWARHGLAKPVNQKSRTFFSIWRTFMDQKFEVVAPAPANACQSQGQPVCEPSNAVALGLKHCHCGPGRAASGQYLCVTCARWHLKLTQMQSDAEYRRSHEAHWGQLGVTSRQASR